MGNKVRSGRNRQQDHELVGERARVDYEKPDTVLKSNLGEIGIAYIDLREAFRRHPDPAALFLNGENQTHISPLGHEVLAGEIFRYMRER